MGGSRLTVVIPCHDEAATIGAVVAGARAFADVIVVDDRSSDGSADVAAGAGATVITSTRPGYDGALDTGLRAAFAQGCDFVISLDADGEHDPALIAEFRRRFEGGAELICGYRSAPQRLAEYVVAAAGLALFGVRDLLCGMKGYARPVLAAYIASGEPLRVNMSPAVIWRRGGGALQQVRVTGERRRDRPRFGRALAANLAILQALQGVLAMPSGRGAAGAAVRGQGDPA